MKRREPKKIVLDDKGKRSLLQIPYFVLSISLIVTIFVTYFYYSSAKAIDAQRFENRANRIKFEIQNHIDTYVALLRAGRGFIYASKEINKNDFSKFVDNFDLRNQYRGVLAIGYSKVFTAAEKDILLEKLKKEGVTEFNLRPDTPRELYQSVIYIEPLDDRNRLVLGFDMSSEETRRKALETARDTGEFAASGKVSLIQEKDQDNQTGFLIYVPVYKTKDNPQSAEIRKSSIDGYIYSPFKANDFIKEIVRDGNIEEVSFKIYDSEISNDNLLAIGNGAQVISDSVLKGQNEIEFGSRKWIITYEPTKKFQQQSLVWWTPIIFFLGLTIDVILFFLSFSQSRTNLTLIKMAKELTATGNTVQKLLESEKLAREDAEKAAKVKDEFLATVSHELRTPLNVIGGWINILKMGGIEPEVRNKAIETINKNLRHQTELVEHMLTFSDKEPDLEMTNKNSFSFSNLVEQCLETYNAKFWEKSLILQRSISEIDFCGDEDKLRQAINCLLDNAVKYSSYGGKISINLTIVQDHIQLTIKDRGEGIDPDLTPFVFESFRQSDSSTVRKHTGLGLGLSIAKKIIEAHHGTINIKSEGKQKGATVEVTLPSMQNS